VNIKQTKKEILCLLLFNLWNLFHLSACDIRKDKKSPHTILALDLVILTKTLLKNIFNLLNFRYLILNCSYMDNKSIQSRGIDFVKSFFESFHFDRNATSSRLGEVKLYRRISEPWEVVAVKSISISNSLDQQEMKNLQVFYS